MDKTIHFHKTDGSPSRWPVCGKLPDGGSVDRLRSDDKHVVQFLEKLAGQLVECLNYPGGTRLRIDGLPDGYGLFSRNTEGGRQDRYLRGSTFVLHFRSTAEFAPHAAWLLTDPLLDPSNCRCRYCCKRADLLRKPRNQLKSPNRTPVEPDPSPVSPPHVKRYASPALPQARRRHRQASPGPPQRSVRGVSRQVSLCEISPQQDGIERKASLPAQLSDLAALAQSRLYRDQELIWYILDKPLCIRVHSHPEATHTINLWPGIARTTVCPSPRVEQLTGATEGPQILYFVTVATLNRTYAVPQTSIIPFQSYRLDENPLVECRSMGGVVPLDTPDRGFDPLPRSSTLETTFSIDTAAKLSPLELLIADVRIANKVASMWSVTDEFSLDPGVHAAPSPPPGKTLIRTPSLNPSTVDRAQRRYRGLWLGAERIWTGDLLILSFPESGIGFRRKTSTSSFENTQVEERVNDLPIEHRNPEDKQVFLKLGSLTPIATKDGIRIYATGYLYRLLPSPGFAQGSRLDGASLPLPPDGFVFSPVLSVGIEAKFPVDLIRGRYYPQLLSLVDGQPLPEELALESMEGCCQADPAMRRPVKHTRESREDLLKAVRESVLRVE